MSIEQPNVVGSFPATMAVRVVGDVPPTPKSLAWLLGALEWKCPENGSINARFSASNARVLIWNPLWGVR